MTVETAKTTKKALKKGDFIEVEYTGKLKEKGIVFDTTNKETAEKEGIAQPNQVYGPVIVCLGEGHLIKGLDKELEGKQCGKHSVELPPEKAFGKKSAKLVQMIPLRKFKEQNIQPMPGLQVNIDGHMATIKSVSGGRILVDLNHPLSGRDVIYDVDVKRIVAKAEEKIQALADLSFNQKGIKVTLKDGVAQLKLSSNIPAELTKTLEDGFGKKASELIPEIKSVKIVTGKETADTKEEKAVEPSQN
jgi:FKBP-type peptidyl-prolyl cis-trans isomerase 2